MGHLKFIDDGSVQILGMGRFQQARVSTVRHKTTKQISRLPVIGHRLQNHILCSYGPYAVFIVWLNQPLQMRQY